MKSKLWKSVCFVIMTLSMPMPDTALADDVTKEEADTIDALIEELASPNDPKSLIRTSRYLTFPPDWNHKAQRQVSQAARSLVNKGRSAFPQMVARAGDNRFSFVSTSGNGAMSSRSVGYACGTILEVQLDVFETTGVRPSYFWTVVEGEGKGDVNRAKWWEERKDKSLFELQIESVEWAIEQHTQLRKDWRKKNVDKDDLKQLTEVIAANKKTLSKLQSTKQPIEPTVHPFKPDAHK